MDVDAHAHIARTEPAWAVGYICARSKRALLDSLLHEVAHLAADSGHDDKWRKKLTNLGGRVPAAHKKRPRK